MRVGILDGNNICYKSYASFKESRGGLLTNSVGIPTTCLFSMFRTLLDLVVRIKLDRIIVCWDITGSYYRREFFPLYKKHRKYVDMQDYFAELDACRDHLEQLGINQVIVKGIEADDLIGIIAHKLRPTHRVIIISDDKDFYQVVREGIKIWRPIKNEFKTYDDVKEEFGMEPQHLPRIKALTGEDTDFIPGINDIDEKKMKIIKCGLGEKTAMKILGKQRLYEAIHNWKDNPKSKKQWGPLLLAKEKQIMKSWKLARIRVKIEQYKDWEQKLLENIETKVLEEKKPSLKKVLRLKEFLEFKTLNLVGVLKSLGVNPQ
jgi:5'-3' exonuclease